MSRSVRDTTICDTTICDRTIHDRTIRDRTIHDSELELGIVFIRRIRISIQVLNRI